jgi:hypothetical protein
MIYTCGIKIDKQIFKNVSSSKQRFINTMTLAELIKDSIK